MNTLLKILILILFVQVSISCNQESKKKTIETMSNMLEPDFKDKESATKEINQLVKDYLGTFKGDSINFDRRYNMFSQNYLNKMQRYVDLAKNANRRTLERLMLSEQIQVFSIRKTFTYDNLNKLSIREVLVKLNEGNMVFGMSTAEFKNLFFYDKNQASGTFKTAFSVSPLLFDREGEGWKMDPLGDPLHQKMKEEKLASLQNKTYQEFKEMMHETFDITEESWIPLKER